MNKLIEEYTQRIKTIRNYIENKHNLSSEELSKLDLRIQIFQEFIYKLQSI